MSSILKALRKLEQQNQASARPDILQPSLRPADTGRSRPWRVVCGALLAGVLAGGLMAALVFKPESEQPVGALSPAAMLSSAPQHPAPDASVPVVAVNDPVAPEPFTRLSGSPPVDQVSVSPPAEVATATIVQEVRMESFDIPPAGFQRDEPRSDGSLPYLVSEIIFLEDGGSMAVVNDLPVMEGTMVDGALLKQILADRVVLERDGRQVEVGLMPAQN